MNLTVWKSIDLNKTGLGAVMASYRFTGTVSIGSDPPCEFMRYYFLKRIPHDRSSATASYSSRTETD